MLYNILYFISYSILCFISGTLLEYYYQNGISIKFTSNVYNGSAVFLKFSTCIEVAMSCIFSHNWCI